MFTRTKNRKAISAVLTTLIILVASVVLGTGVVLYGTSLFQTGAQSESISVQGVKMWVSSTDANGTSWGAAAIRNTGDKLESVDTINVRGTAVPFSGWYVADSISSAANIQSQFVSAKNPTTGHLADYLGPAGSQSTDTCTPAANLRVDVDGLGGKQMLCMYTASGPVSLKPGDSAVIYFKVPAGVLTPVDTGATSSVAIYAGKVGAPQTVSIASP